MSKITLLVSSLLAFAIPSPSRACGVTEEEMKILEENHDVAIANHCENALVSAFSIGSVYVGETAEQAARAPNATDIAFDVSGGKVVRVRHTAPTACISTQYFKPLIVVNATSAIPTVDAINVSRDARGVHVEVRGR